MRQIVIQERVTQFARFSAFAHQPTFSAQVKIFLTALRVFANDTVISFFHIVGSFS